MWCWYPERLWVWNLCWAIGTEPIMNGTWPSYTLLPVNLNIIRLWRGSFCRNWLYFGYPPQLISPYIVLFFCFWCWVLRWLHGWFIDLLQLNAWCLIQPLEVWVISTGGSRLRYIVYYWFEQSIGIQCLLPPNKSDPNFEWLTQISSFCLYWLASEYFLHLRSGWRRLLQKYCYCLFW